MKHLTDEEIMLAVANGQVEKLSILFDRYHVRIYNFFNKMLSNKMLSEDLTQDVFVKVLRYRSSYKQGNFTSWIYTIARNIFSSHYQKIKKERSNLIEDNRLDANEKLITDTNQEDLDHLQRALLQLNNSDRELIVMHRFHEIKYQEMATILNSTEGAIKVKMHRALKKLKDVYFETVQ